MDILGSRKSCAIIIVTYNSSSSIDDCLGPLMAIPGLEIVVVDNKSQDDCAMMVKRKFTTIKVIALNENLGFGRACNIGVAASSGSCLMFLNPDAVVLPDALKTLVTFLEDHPQVGIVGAHMVDPLGESLQSKGDRPSVTGLFLDKPLAWLATRIGSKGLWRRMLGEFSTKFRLSSEPEPVSWVSGAALCCRRSTWDAIGGFDENFFLYYEDVDLCLRASQAGWEVWHVPDAVVSHQSGSSFAGDVDFQKRVYFTNQRYFFQKHYGHFAAFFLTFFQKIYSHFKLYRHLANDRIGPPG